MPAQASVTTNKHVFAAKAFITELDNPNRPVFAFAGKPTEWGDNEASDTFQVPEVNTTIRGQRDVLKNIVFAKPITSEYAHLSLKVIPWEANKVYTEWKFDKSTLYPDTWDVDPVTGKPRPVYVTYQDGESTSVFLCISNNNDGLSTQHPGTDMPEDPSRIIKTYRLDKKTTDMYIWKWLFDVSNELIEQWGSEYFIPVPVTDDEKTDTHKNVEALLSGLEHKGEILQINTEEGGEVKIYVEENNYLPGKHQIKEGSRMENSDTHIALDVVGDGYGCVTSVVLSACTDPDREEGAEFGTQRAKGGIETYTEDVPTLLHTVTYVVTYERDAQGNRVPQLDVMGNPLVVDGHPVYVELPEEIRTFEENVTPETIVELSNQTPPPYDDIIIESSYYLPMPVPRNRYYIVYKVEAVTVMKPGEGYNEAEVTIRSIDTTTEILKQPVFTMKVNPEVLLGKDPANDICARWVTIRAPFIGDEDKLFPLSIKYRQVGLVQNLQKKDGSFVNTKVNMLDTMYVDNVTKDFQTGLVLEGVETHAKANIVYIESQSNGAKMMLSNRVGSFYTYADKRVNDNEIVEVVQYSKNNSIEISSSGRIRQIVESDVYNNRGNVIYIENLKPIDRKEGQMEIFLLTIEL